MDLSKQKGRHAVVLLSGGVDSACCAHFLKGEGYPVKGVFVDFGQPAARREAQKVKEISNWISCELSEIKVQFTGDLSSPDGEVLGRNAFLINLALMSSGADACVIGIGIHSGTPYYDCGPAFLSSMSRVINEHTDGRCSLCAPFLDWSKKEVYAYAKSIHLPLEATYSCETNSDKECGFCPSCADRELYHC